MTKYNSTDSLTTLLPEDDAATVAWGGSWKTPTKTQLTELTSSSNTTRTWVTNYNGSGINGELITSKKNGNTLFFPTAGSARNGSIGYVDSNICYLLSSIVTNDNTKFNAITGGRYSSFGSGMYFRDLGLTIRPVAD